MSDLKPIRLTVQNNNEILFEGQADRITSYNEFGKFDVYPMHANFISILEKKMEVYSKNQKIKEIEFEKAIMKVKNDEVNIFLGIEMLQIEG